MQRRRRLSSSPSERPKSAAPQLPFPLGRNSSFSKFREAFEAGDVTGLHPEDEQVMDTFFNSIPYSIIAAATKHLVV